MSNHHAPNRRAFLARTAATTAVLSACGPAFVLAETARPTLPYGVASGDVTSDSAIVWSRCDRPARLILEYATTESFRDLRRVVGPDALPASDYTARIDLRDLPAGQTICYRAMFQDLADLKRISLPTAGRFRTAPRERGDVFFLWSGDTAGQGFGINPDWGGMRIYETMRKLQPNFFIHSGDTIYADVPILDEAKHRDGSPVLMPDGKSVWKNLVTPEKSKVAETLAEFRGNHGYNLHDHNLRAFNAEVAQIVQWDDHEVRNNWFPTQTLHDDDRYTVKECSVLAARARQAFLDYTPIRPQTDDAKRIYRSFRHGPTLDVFVLDQRSYRGPNSTNRQPEQSPDTAFMGVEQIRWLKHELVTSKATWKVLCSDLPLGLIVNDQVDGKPAFENAANGDGPPLGRELEIADLLRFIKIKGVRNVIWLTADVHYAAAHYYDPAKAQFTEFDPFWEFVAGPLNSGTFGPNVLDNTFGPQVKFNSVSKGLKPNRPPSDGLQFFGAVRIDAASEVMTVTLHNLRGDELYRVELPPARG